MVSSIQQKKSPVHVNSRDSRSADYPTKYLLEPFDIFTLEDESKSKFAFESKEDGGMDKDFWETEAGSSSKKIFSKRKSESWNSKPLESSSRGASEYPDSQDANFPAISNGCEQFLFPNVPTIDSSFMFPSRLDTFGFDRSFVSTPAEDLAIFQRTGIDLGIDFGSGSPSMINSSRDDVFYGSSERLRKTPKSEEWDARPKLKRAKSMPLTEDEKEHSRRRTKWSADELKMLWNGILNQGNNWKEISKVLTTRSYFQIKDKGRRLLFLRGWTTGRNKNDTDDGNRKAKVIAKSVLAEIK